jgi:glucan phosphoethanolaminetransferase (alkaline phosphatase superfamily)
LTKIAADHRDQAGGTEISFITIFFLSFFSTAFYTLMEWLYFVTKPSYMSGMDVWGKIKILLQSNLVVFIATVCIIALLFLCARVISIYKIRQIIKWSAVLIPVFFIGITLLLLIDNFTYTLFRFGIVSTSGIFRGIYGLCFLFIIFRVYKVIYPSLQQNPGNSKRSPVLWIAIFILSLSLLITFPDNPQEFNTQTLVDTGKVTTKPNIILVGSDGVSAKNLSLYGYDRETTPYLEKLASESLLMTNHLTNSGNTTGSVTSIFTGKLPSKIRVIYPPDMLRSVDAYQHLPGILKELGYKTVEIAIPHYLDATELNILHGFDRVNDKLVDNGPVIQKLRTVFSNDVVFFLETIYERIDDRLCHIFYIHQMENPYSIVTQTSNPRIDNKRLEQLDELIKEEDKPFFVHLHLLGTHGGKFNPRLRQFSKGESQDQEWMTDFYDDSILDFDGNINRIVNSLEKAGKLDNTILIIYTDHAQNWKPLERIPLMIRFPKGEYAGTITENSQNLDIAPTILDYLDIPQPSWMGGQSLLNGNPTALRPIYSASVEKTENTANGLLYHDHSNNPPFYQFDYFTTIVCNKWVKLSTIDNQWSVGTLDSKPGLCDGLTVPSTSQMENVLLDQLKKDGFDVSSVHMDE